MAVTLNYSNEPDAAAIRRRDRLWAWQGVAASFIWLFWALIWMIYILAHTQWHMTGVILEFCSSLGALALLAWFCRRHTKSWAFAKGAILGGIIPFLIATLLVVMRFV